MLVRCRMKDGLDAMLQELMPHAVGVSDIHNRIDNFDFGVRECLLLEVEEGRFGLSRQISFLRESARSACTIRADGPCRPVTMTTRPLNLAPTLGHPAGRAHARARYPDLPHGTPRWLPSRRCRDFRQFRDGSERDARPAAEIRDTEHLGTPGRGDRDQDFAYPVSPSR